MRGTKRSAVLFSFVACAALLMSAGTALSGERVARLRARHRAGQTILTWNEVDPPVVREPVSAKDLGKIKVGIDKARKVRYRVYRSDKPIGSVEGMTPVAEVPPLACWNADYYGIYPKPGQMALRYVVENGGEPVPPGTGIYAHNPAEEGEAYYAVTVVAGGTEDARVDATAGAGNSLAEPVEETVGPGVPVLQRVERPGSFCYVKNPTLYHYVRWEAPPNCSVAGKPFDYLVAVPPKKVAPAPVGLHLHCWGGSLMGGYAWWSDAEKGAILVSSNQIPYDWWTGYHERLWTGRPLKSASDWREGVIRPYSQARMLSFLDWVGTRWKVDLARTFVAGNSMGGSGSLMLAIRYPERIAYARSWVGVHIPAKSPRFRGSYEGVYGKPEWGVRFEDGTPVWDHYDDTWFLRRHVGKEIGFLAFSNGKNDGGIGWPQAVEFLKALQETRRPHLFVWGMAGHGQRARLPVTGGERVMPIDIRTDAALPAFTRCSLDDDPGTATKKPGDQLEKEKAEIEEWNRTHKTKKRLDAYDGAPEGQVNLFLYWEAGDAVDEEDRWEMTVGLVDRAPEDECTVSVTPRRRQKFRPDPGEEVTWTNTSVAGGGEVQSGRAVVDRWGLVTLAKVVVGKGKNRLSIGR